ncbi:MAG: ATP-sensitive inward rectifier potassium channel 10 [Proteobacteria bacterium]|nr:ATP-sensitive inward rectifier potassium channel 10 [Pseudomonadota bacterium]
MNASAPRPRFGEKVVRLGVRQTPWADVYFQVMDSSWPQLMGLVVAAFVAANALFAGLFLLGGDCVKNLAPGSFGQAFFFSVETMSTIGYGAMVPKTTYASMVVTLEALVGVLGFAVVTGLTFAKFARPRARVLFSERAVITRYHGQPALMFRVGNTRTNEVVEATVRVAVLKDEVSPEGQSMRRLHDLRLIRTTTPIFYLSWTVIHPIDVHSPLYGLDAQARHDGHVLVIATLTGIDSTLASQVHARHVYHPDEVLLNRTLVDIIETLPDGQLQIDYRRFHETQLAAEAPSSLGGASQEPG